MPDPEYAPFALNKSGACKDITARLQAFCDRYGYTMEQAVAALVTLFTEEPHDHCHNCESPIHKSDFGPDYYDHRCPHCAANLSPS